MRDSSQCLGGVLTEYIFMSEDLIAVSRQR